MSTVIPAYGLEPRDAASLRNGVAVQRAAAFLARLQPEGTYIRSTPDDVQIVPMDVAHAAIALTKVDQIDRARDAMTWLYQQAIRPNQSRDSGTVGASYAGSWYDALQPDGQPAPGASRGRGEAVGMALIATYSIATIDPGYLDTPVRDERIVDLVRNSVRYLTQSAMQQQDGTFAHSLEYPVAFNEECARMTLGLELASRMLKQAGDEDSATRAATAAMAADRGLRALRHPARMSQGMAYDYYAMAIWGLGTPSEARAEIDWLRSTGLVNSAGVRNWDWQLATATSPTNRLRWWLQAQTVSPSQTFDYAIACVGAGDLRTAIDLEQRWLPLQRPDGGFADAYIFGLRVGVSSPTSYAVARFILLERLLSSVVGLSVST